ncbi:hypothetical protein [Pseudomonas sp. LFM046]|uniref:hypothetical protein n=1 Tax=Pseudomonas sp. LFM046 TaxID=1608357 RepID=UPI001A8CB048|nr:hypothetical protein [Pseudomonas sp. LFM046]
MNYKNVQTAAPKQSKLAQKWSNTLVPAMLAFIILAFSAQPSHAGNTLGSGQPGPPGWSLQLWPYYSKQDSGETANNFFELAWFSDFGVISDTHQDQIELWAGFLGGYRRSDFEGNDSRWGTSTPQLGIEYFYQAHVSDAAPNTEGYRAWWISPTFAVSFPNGSEKTSGFGSGADQYSAMFYINNFFGYDKWQLSVNPVVANYMFRDRNHTDLEDGSRKRLQGGLSLFVADIALGYQLNDNWAVGIHHEYDFYNVADSDFAKAERGMAGPTLNYNGLANKNIFISATVDFDYANHNTERATTLTGSLVYMF